MKIEDNLSDIKERIVKACEFENRDPSEIKLVAVSKTWPITAIEEANLAGQSVFGESRVQEFLPKYNTRPDLEWHFVGHIQSNKINKLLETDAFIHSVDSLQLAERISRRAKMRQKVLNVLLQVNIDDDDAKFGFLPAGLWQDIEKILNLNGLNVCGLMTIGRQYRNQKDARSGFAKLRKLRDELCEAKKLELPELSMGMSHDFEEAIKEGATIIRVGSAIFGDRR